MMTQPTPAQRRKVKLRMRFKERIDAEIASTEEKLQMLREIQAERDGQQVSTAS